MTTDSARTVACSRCERKFKDEHGLKQHMADVHRVGKRARAPERYPIFVDDADIHAEYEPRQFAVGVHEDDY